MSERRRSPGLRKYLTTLDALQVKNVQLMLVCLFSVVIIGLLTFGMISMAVSLRDRPGVAVPGLKEIAVLRPGVYEKEMVYAFAEHVMSHLTNYNPETVAANFAVAYFENTQPFLPVAVELSLRRLGIAHWHLGAVYLVLSFLFFLIICNSVEKIYRAYFRKEKPYRGPVNLPLWPEPTGTLHFVMGEMHDPRTGHMVKKPTWLVIPESGLYTNVFITGATGSRKDR